MHSCFFDSPKSALVACCSVLLNKPVQEQMVVLGSITLGGVVNPVQDLASSMQIALEAGATKVLLPMASASDIAFVPAETFTKFQVSFYSDPLMLCIRLLGFSNNKKTKLDTRISAL
ncbi:S16 family serine protease [Pseudoalteromonas tetraodonis]|uniref:S16 family serine protease n=1 Tax=Pseudoalteromonas tetraodonis TaxID=43659 RepID=UPI0037355E7F